MLYKEILTNKSMTCAFVSDFSKYNFGAAHTYGAVFQATSTSDSTSDTPLVRICLAFQTVQLSIEQSRRVRSSFKIFNKESFVQVRTYAL